MALVPLIAISSPRKGAGKTTVLFNLAAALWQDEFKVHICSSNVAEFVQKRQKLCLDKNLNLPFPQVYEDVNTLPLESGEKEVCLVEVPSEEAKKYMEIMARAHTLLTIGTDKQDVIWQTNDEYLNLIWQTKMTAARQGRKYLNWILVENMASDQNEIWKDELGEASRRFGFRIAPRLANRETYQHIKEGYCAADLIHPTKGWQMTMADVYARREILELTDFMWKK